MLERLRRLMRWVQVRRRRILIVLGIIVFFYLLGRFTSPSSIPNTCLIYG
jgi:hypothetical protein